MKKAVGKIALLPGLILASILILDYPWISANAHYYWARPKTSQPVQSTTAATASLPNKDQVNILQIPSLQISAPVLEVAEANETAFQAALENGVVHYPGTAEPGQPGNDYIFGHSSDFIWSNGHYKNVFATLPHIQIGAEIELSDATGNIYTYIVQKTVVISPDNTSYLSQGDYKNKQLTLQTSYPVGTALQRFLVIAELK